MPGATAQDYINEGFQVAQAGKEAYSSTPGILPWSDSWINFAMDYAKSQWEFDQNKQMWNLMNEYNSPANQMKRFKEAGLNPMLAYSQGTPGNASSSVQYNRPNGQITPQADRMRNMEAASQMIGMVSNLVQNVFGMYDSSLDLQLKKNEVAYSNYDRRLLEHWAPNGSLALSPGRLWSEGQQEKLNPFSPNFDPYLFEFLSKRGSLPQFFSDWFFNIPKKDYTESRTRYQNFYNEKLLPLFEQYQQGKIDLQEYEKQLEEYQKGAREMIPPELRGILEPVFQWLSPFIKFIFKSSRGSFNHSVK